MTSPDYEMSLLSKPLPKLSKSVNLEKIPVLTKLGKKREKRKK